MRYKCGDILAGRDAGEVNPIWLQEYRIPVLHYAIGYANRSGVPFARPFIKYTPTWPRSFMPTQQSQRKSYRKNEADPGT